MRAAPIHVHLHVHHHCDERLDQVLALVQTITQQEEITMADLSALSEEVASNTDVSASVAALVNRLADEIEATGADQGAIDALVQQLRTNDTALGDLVTANTPAAPGADQPPAETPPSDTGVAPDAGGDGSPAPGAEPDAGSF